MGKMQRLLCFLGVHKRHCFELESDKFAWYHKSRCQCCKKSFSMRQSKSGVGRIIEAIEGLK